MRKKHLFQTVIVIFSLFLSALPLTGCGGENTDSLTFSETEEDKTGTHGKRKEAGPGGENAPGEHSPAPFSHSTPPKTPDDGSQDYVFPETAPFVDDTGKSMQRDGDCFYSYCAGNLIRFDTRTDEVTPLYQTASTHMLDFCLHENDIYFVERTGYDSLDGRGTSLWRVGKGGENLTLLKDDIANAATIRDWDANYDIDIYDDILYLIHYASEYQNGEYVSKTANLYYRLQRDGTVSELDESETLYGILPGRFSPVFDSDFPTFPYAMRNYGYLFMQDSSGILYRMDPVSGVRENLPFNTRDGNNFCFSGDLVLFYSFYLERDASLFHLTDKTFTNIEIIPDQFAIDYRSVSPSEQGFLFCCEVRETDSPASDADRWPRILQIQENGAADLLTAASQSVFDQYFSLEEYDFYDMLLSDNSCILSDSLYCYRNDESGCSLTRFSLREGDAPEELTAYSRYPAASSPLAILPEEQNRETEIGTQSSVSLSLRKAFLEERTDADREINRALSEIYTDFEEYVDELIQEQKEELEEDPELYESFDYASRYDFSLYASCNYMDDSVISLCLDYYQYYAYAAHGYYWSDYYVFDRKTGERLTCEDFVGNSARFLSTARPYVEQASGWGFDDEMLLEPSRFSLSEDGYTLYFAPYDIDCYAAGSFLITVPYEAFEKEL